MATISNNFQPISSHHYSCELCQFYSRKKKNYEEHLLTRKHNSAIIINKIQQNPAAKFCCAICSKEYKDNSGLWRHKKKCFEQKNDNQETNKETSISDKELITMLIKQNEKLMNIVETGTNNNNNQSYNTNSHNKTFNLQFFLNKTCKDAMNIDEFVSSIRPQLDDLEATGRLGYVEGISKIITNNLNKLNAHYRPFHCSDQKREVFYIKENNEWTKEDKDKPILTKAIKVIANENIKNISKWRQEYPGCTDSESKKNDIYLQIVSNSMSGLTKEESNKNINKIITNVAKQVTIDKDID